MTRMTPCNAWCGEKEGDLRDTSISLGSMASTLLCAGEDKVKLLRVVDGIEHGQDGTAGVSKDVLHAVAEHHLVEDLATGHAHERVVVVWLDI